jgi:hypothetical protein
MTRLIDTLCGAHQALILGARMWPAGTALTDCRDCTDLLLAAGVVEYSHGVDEREELAIHEAGHAFTYLRDDLPVQYVTLARNDRFAAHTSFEIFHPGSLDTLTGMWAGYTATRTWLSRLGQLDAAAEVDLANSARSDAAFICSATSDPDLIGEAKERAEWVIGRHFARIERVAEALLAAGRMTGEQIDEVAWG